MAAADELYCRRAFAPMAVVGGSGCTAGVCQRGKQYFSCCMEPVFLLRFVRRESPKVGLLVAYVLQVAAFAFQFRGMVPIPEWDTTFSVCVGVPSILPYAVDRL